MIAVALAAMGLASPASGQKDAAEKAQEGAIEHWIEYYKGQQRQPAAAVPQLAPAPIKSTEPAEGTGTGATLPDTVERK